MADYNIYIHSITSGGNSSGNQTVPWGSRQDEGGGSPTTPNGSKETGSFLSKVLGFAQNPDSLASAGTSAFTKGIPYVAIAMAVVKISEAVVNEYEYWISNEAGEYRGAAIWEDFKTGVNSVLHPFSSTYNHYKAVRQLSRTNQKMQMQRDLFGDSVINSIAARGI